LTLSVARLVRLWSPWRTVLAIAVVAIVLRVAWVLCVPTIVVGDFATYRESAQFLAEHGRLDDGFIYMPGLVLLLAGIDRLGGEVLAAKLLGAGFGALTAVALYVLARAAARMTDAHSPRARGGGTTQAGAGGPAHAGGPAAGGGGVSAEAVGICVALLYFLWIPGLAMASVVGTDVPCAALICVALACLFHWGPRRPLVAAVAFGAAMGAAAWFRAVALPLVALGGGYWLAARAAWRSVFTRTALGVLVALVVLAPWAWRNFEHEGALSFTDTHGGVTALMGNDPNTDGTYSRGLGDTFRELTGRTFLSRPHRETDRVAYALARRWMAFQPGFTLGMVALRLERLLAPERGLLYWSIYRPGILPPEATLAFNQRRAWLTGVTDAYGWLLVLGLTAGITFAVRDRAFGLLVPLCFALAMLATYAIFVAEPRYRLTSEIVAFPLAAFGIARLVAVVRAGARTEWAALLGTAVLLAVFSLGGVATVSGGRRLRDHDRWAISVSTVDGQPRATYWRAVFGPSDARFQPSPLQGGAGATTLRAAAPGQPDSTVDLLIPDLDPPPGHTLALRASLSWSTPAAGCDVGTAPAASRSPVLEVSDPAVPAAVFATAGISSKELAGTTRVFTPEHETDSRAGLRLALRLRAPPPASATAAVTSERACPPISVRISNLALTLAPSPPTL
jgi:hypothetical protein